MIQKMRLAAMAAVLMLVSACLLPPAGLGVVYARRAPPERRVEVVTVAPSRGMVWIGGRWEWQNDAYAWVPGRWAEPPRGHHEWVAGRWDHNEHGWFFVEGHWQ
jgi:WXXGXW repeat (2 copies)